MFLVELAKIALSFPVVIIALFAETVIILTFQGMPINSILIYIFIQLFLYYFQKMNH